MENIMSMTANEFKTKFILDGGAFNKADAAWKAYKEEHGITTGGGTGFAGQVKDFLVEGHKTQEEFREFIKSEAPEGQAKRYHSIYRWALDLSNTLHNRNG